MSLTLREACCGALRAAGKLPTKVARFRSTPPSLVLARRQQILSLVRVIHGLVREHFLVDGLAVHELQRHIEYLRAKQGVALDVGLEPAVDHRLEATARAVHRHNLEIAGL